MSKIFPNVLVVGMHFRGEEAKAAVQNMIPPVTLTLEREPDNRFDQMAIKVLYNNQFIGYIEAKQACFIAPHMDAGTKFTCTVMDLITKNNNLHPVCTIQEVTTETA